MNVLLGIVGGSCSIALVFGVAFGLVQLARYPFGITEADTKYHLRLGQWWMAISEMRAIEHFNQYIALADNPAEFEYQKRNLQVGVQCADSGLETEAAAYFDQYLKRTVDRMLIDDAAKSASQKQDQLELEQLIDQRARDIVAFARRC